VASGDEKVIYHHDDMKTLNSRVLDSAAPEHAGVAFSSPFHAEPLPELEWSCDAGSLQSRKRILVVDDDASVRELIARVLEEHDYEVITAATGRAAVSLFPGGSPDLVLLDLALPYEDGWQVLRMMRQLWPCAPIVLVTAQPHQAEHAASAGADELMEKPLEFPTLLKAIKEFTSEPQRRRLRSSTVQARTSFRFLCRTGDERAPGGIDRPFAGWQENAGSPTASVLATSVGPERNCVLLVDDDPAIREFLGRALKAENYDVVFARDGQEAASKYLIVPYDLVLLDLSMPRMDGWEAFHLIHQRSPLLPIIILTALPRQYSRAVAARADALMEKPLDMPLFLQTIRDLLAQSAGERVARLTDPTFQTRLLRSPEVWKERQMT
jgi:DNA-binding response OmpR family regulator